MLQPTPPAVSPRDILRTIFKHPLRWLVPAGVITIAALVFAILRPKEWEASQALLVRDEVSIDGTRDANSTRADNTKAAQETVLELVHSQAVLKQALEIVGPDARSAKTGFPTLKDVENLGDEIKLVPPKGGEFGKTDIFYLKAHDRDRERALELALTVSKRLQASFEELRKTKANSLIQELEKTVSLARQELEQCTRQLSAMERQVGGADLGELRIMNELPSGMSDLRNESFAIESELRKEANERLQTEQLLAILKAATVDQGELIACPNSLLNAQPGLKRLKEGLIDAQIKSATLLGTMAPDHPQVQAAREVAEEIGNSLYRELAIAIRAIESDLRLSGERIAKLEKQKADLRARFDNIADIRARYGNLAAMAKHRGEILKTAELELAEARSKQAAAHTGTLLQLIGEPVTGTRPVGPGRTVIVLAGMVGGLIVGLGIVVLTAQPQKVEQQNDGKRVVATRLRPSGEVSTEHRKPELVEDLETDFEEPELHEPSVPAMSVPVSAQRTTASAPTNVAVVGARSEAKTGPLTFRQALERIATVQSR
jgi:succinoglycan biosynthesis transport protein ExoP